MRLFIEIVLSLSITLVLYGLIFSKYLNLSYGFLLTYGVYSCMLLIFNSDLRLARFFLIYLSTWTILSIIALFINNYAAIVILLPIIATILITYTTFRIFKKTTIWKYPLAFVGIILVGYYSFVFILRNEFMRHQNDNNTLVQQKWLEAGELPFVDVKGDTILLKEIKSEITYIEFWFTSCKPCILKMPVIKKLRHKYSANDKVVFVSIVEGQSDTFADFQHSSRSFADNFDFYLYAPKNTSKQLQQIFQFNGFPYEIIYFKDRIKSSHTGFTSSEASYYISEKENLIDKLLNNHEK